MIEKRETIDQYVGFYRGIVKKHLSNGRCKVWIPAVYPDTMRSDPDKLPDALQAAPLFALSPNSERSGTYSYPKLESIVWCFFENNDPNYPVYFAATHEFGDAEAQWDSLSPSTSNIKKIVVDDVEILINSADKSISISNGGTAKIEMTPEGKITISGEGIEIDAANGVLINGTNVVTTGTSVKTVASASAYTMASRIGIYAKGGAVHIQADDPEEAIFVN